MSRIRTTSALAVAAVGAATLVAPVATADARPAPQGHRSLATVLAADGNHFDQQWADFDIVDRAVHAVLKAKPDSALGIVAQGRKPVTAFLPTDRAFRVLVTDLTGTKPATERGTFRAMTRMANVDTLESVLLYHAVPGATVTYRQALKGDGARLQTALSGGVLSVQVTAANQVRLRDADPNDRNATVLRKAADLNRGNRQIAHGIDRVLRPSDL
jgi:uncharacterized surface protein with fasciclin (FAS1) repeats